jgi:cobalt-zinc-cadmium efflux system outer membrane protein
MKLLLKSTPLFFFLINVSTFATTEPVTKIITPQFLIEIINQENLDNQQEKNILTQQTGKLLTSRGAFDFILDAELQSISEQKDYSELRTTLTYPTPFLGIDIWAGHRKTNGVLPSYWDNGATTSEGEINLGAKIPLLQGLLIDQRRANFWQNEFALAAQKKQYEQKYLEIVKKTLNLYLDWALLKKRELIAKNLLNMSEQRASWLESKVKAGAIALFEKEDNDRTIFQRKSLLLDIQNKYQQSWLSLVLQLNGFHSLSLTPEAYSPSELETILALQLPDLESWKDKSLANRGDFQALDDLIEAQKVSIKMAQQEYLPQLNLKSELAKNRGTTLNEEEDEYKIMLNFEIPLQLREARGKYMLASAEYENLLLRKKFQKQKIETDIMMNFMDVENIKNRLSITKEEVALAAKLEKGEQRKFNLGDSTMVILNLREQATAEAQLKYQELLVQLWKAKINLYVAAGEVPNF